MIPLKKIYHSVMFQPNVFGVILNPFYISRRSIYLKIKKNAHQIKGRTLDIGCGQKPYKNLFLNTTEYLGMDIEQSGHDHTNECIDIYYDGINFPFKTNEFDSIICNQVFEHLPNPEVILSEISRVLKPGGILLITVPFIADEHEQPYDFFRYTTFILNKLMNENQLKILIHKKLNNNIILIFTQLWITYLYKLTKTKYPIISLLLNPILFMPFTIIGLILSFFIPNSNDFYLDSFLLIQSEKNIINNKQ
jgi:SAM-dependent methyltransferase